MGEPVEPPKRESLEKIVKIVQNVGLIAGGLGSVAVLFFWIGNVIVISRLREYNLYGIVHYTDEYVKEAGYQFLQDIFTFFHDPILIAMSVAVVIMIIFFVPVGPALGPNDPSKNPVHWSKRINQRYIIFLIVTVASTLALALDMGARNLARDITNNADALQRIMRTMDTAARENNPAFFSFKKNHAADIFQARFLADLELDVQPTKEWIVKSIKGLGDAKGADNDQIIDNFNKEFGITEDPEKYETKEGIETSKAFQTLKQLSMSQRLNRKIYHAVMEVKNIFVSLTEGGLTTESDYANLVGNPGSYAYLNGLIDNLTRMRENVTIFFELNNPAAKTIMEEISRLTRIRLGQKLVTLSFLTMIGILVYLVLNVTELRTFEVAEKSYYCLMIVLFLTTSIMLPTVYGRYNFEFKIQRVNDIAFTDEKVTVALKKTLLDNLGKEQPIYVLGPTRDKEIIVSAIPKKEAAEATPQIIIIDRSAIRYVSLEPVKSHEIPTLVNTLKRGRS